MSDTPIYDKIENPEPEKLTLKEKVSKVLTPTVRRWAYGVTAAALTVGATLAGKPEFIPVVMPLIIAIWYVTPEGEPR